MARSVVRNSARNSRRQAYPHQGARTLPRANRVAYIKNAYPFVDRDGKHDGPAQLLQYIQGPVDLLSASIVGTESITNKQGTASVTVSAGKLSVGAGTLWSFVLSNGSKYEFGSGGWVWDVSANDRPLSVPVDACKEGREFGSDTLNLDGFTISDGKTYGLDKFMTRLIPVDTLIPNQTNGNSCAFVFSGGV